MNNVSRVLAIFTGAYSRRANCCCTFKLMKRFDERHIGGGRWALIVRDSVNKKAVENRPGPSKRIKKNMLYSHPDGCFLKGERMLVLPDRGPALCDHTSVRLENRAGVFKPIKELFQRERFGERVVTGYGAPFCFFA